MQPITAMIRDFVYGVSGLSPAMANKPFSDAFIALDKEQRRQAIAIVNNYLKHEDEDVVAQADYLRGLFISLQQVKTTKLH